MSREETRKQMREIAEKRIAELERTISAAFEEIGELSDEHWIGAEVYGPDEDTVFVHTPWQASGGCEWVESRQDAAWSVKTY